jgi:hypothetical protein
VYSWTSFYNIIVNYSTATYTNFAFYFPLFSRYLAFLNFRNKLLYIKSRNHREIFYPICLLAALCVPKYVTLFPPLSISLLCGLVSMKGLAVAQAVSRWLPTATARVHIRAACGFCGGQSGAGAGFLRVLRFPLSNILPNSPSS